MGQKKLDLNNNSIDKLIFKSQNWLLKSGIQNSKNKSNIFGSVNAWYDADIKSYSFIYSEINGYFLTLMCYLFKVTNNKIFIEKALASSKWLIEKAQHKNGGFKCLFIIDKNSPNYYKENLIYSFDSGVILNGLCSLYKLTKKKFLLKSAEKCANWLIYSCSNDDGILEPIFDFKEDKFYSSDKEWSTTYGSYHTKISIGLLNYYSITKKKIYRKYAEKICLNSLSFQKKNGRFISFSDKGGTNAHPHCYSAEGLWTSGKFLKNKKMLNASRKAAKWIISQMNSKGNIPRLYKNNRPIFIERVDALAQVIRLNFLHYNPNKINLLSDIQLKKILKILLSYQVKNSRNVKTNGSFLWGKKSSGQKVNHANSWVTFFSIQSLYLIKDYINKKKINFDYFDLV